MAGIDKTYVNKTEYFRAYVFWNHSQEKQMCDMGSIISLYYDPEDVQGLNEDAVKNSWTHALHGKAGIQLRDSFTQTDPRTAVSKTYNNLLPTTVLRLKGLSEDPVKKSWTHALHGLVGVGGLGNFTTADGKFKTDRTKQIEDLRQLNKP